MRVGVRFFPLLFRCGFGLCVVGVFVTACVRRARDQDRGLGRGAAQAQVAEADEVLAVRQQLDGELGHEGLLQDPKRNRLQVTLL